MAVDNTGNKTGDFKEGSEPSESKESFARWALGVVRRNPKTTIGAGVVGAGLLLAPTIRDNFLQNETQAVEDRDYFKELGKNVNQIGVLEKMVADPLETVNETVEHCERFIHIYKDDADGKTEDMASIQDNLRKIIPKIEAAEKEKTDLLKQTHLLIEADEEVRAVAKQLRDAYDNKGISGPLRDSTHSVHICINKISEGLGRKIGFNQAVDHTCRSDNLDKNGSFDSVFLTVQLLSPESFKVSYTFNKIRPKSDDANKLNTESLRAEQTIKLRDAHYEIPFPPKEGLPPVLTVTIPGMVTMPGKKNTPAARPSAHFIADAIIAEFTKHKIKAKKDGKHQGMEHLFAGATTPIPPEALMPEEQGMEQIPGPPGGRIEVTKEPRRPFRKQ